MDDFTNECLTVTVAFVISGRVGHTFSEQHYSISWLSGDDKNRPRAGLDQWAYEHGVELRPIQSGKPIQNGFIESFNGRFRDECINEHWFNDISDAKKTSVNGVRLIKCVARTQR